MALGLRVTRGPLAGRVFEIKARLIIGRSGDADIQILGKGVSRHHACVVENDDGQVMLVDLTSRNGTFVGEQRIDRQLLRPGDQFRIGDCDLVFADDVGPDGSALDSDDADLKLASGPAEENTVMDALAGFGCGDPMHLIAVKKAWLYCPACGQKTLPHGDGSR